MAVRNIPAAEVEVDERLVRALLVEQHPDLAGLPLVLLANGWDNAIHRLGDDLVVRMPRRTVAAELVGNEQRWLPHLEEQLPLPIPAPVRLGAPSSRFPWSWSVCRWFEGEVAADAALTDQSAEAIRLGAFLAALHRPAPPEAPANPHRGHAVRDLRDRFTTRVAEVDAVIDAPQVMTRMDELLVVDEWARPPVWIHGDLHSANLVVSDGAIAAVIDWGDVTAGDPACDLAIAWMLFDRVARSSFRRAAGGGESIDDATWCRAQAWALHFAVMYLLHSADSPRFERMGRALLATVLAD